PVTVEVAHRQTAAGVTGRRVLAGKGSVSYAQQNRDRRADRAACGAPTQGNEVWLAISVEVGCLDLNRICSHRYLRLILKRAVSVAKQNEIGRASCRERG